MKYRTFGRAGWQVSEIGYGMWGMGGWTGSDDEQSMRALQQAVDLGCNFFDTAWAYGAGKSEALLGELVRANPERKLYTATKVPPKNLKWPSRREYALDESYPADHIERYVENSLENAGLSSFDLIQLHTWEDLWLADNSWINQLIALKEQEIIHAIGVSINRWEPWNGVQAVRSDLIDAVQVIYNIFDQNPQDELFPACREHNVAVIARVPFDEGTLTGSLTKESSWPVDDWRSTYFVPENLNASVDHAEALRPLIPSEMTMAEMAMRFILSEPAVSTIIPGMRKPHHVDQNMATSESGSLPQGLLDQLADHRWDREPTKWSQ